MVIEHLGAELRAGKGLPLTWFDVLIHLSLTPEGQMPMNTLADSIVLSKSGVTRLVDRMTDAGLIERVACPTDRRIVYASLTDKGRTVLEDAAPFHFEGVERIFNRQLTKEEEKALVSAFSKILDAAAARPRRSAPQVRKEAASAGSGVTRAGIS